MPMRTAAERFVRTPAASAQCEVIGSRTLWQIYFPKLGATLNDIRSSRYETNDLIAPPLQVLDAQY